MSLAIETKQAIVARAKQYMEDHGMTAGEFSKQTQVNEAYLSRIFNGYQTTISGEREVEIKDRYFLLIAQAIGMAVGQKTYWSWVQTREFTEMVTALEEAKLNTETRVLICPTGKGKTFATAKFKYAHPNNTFILTINAQMKLVDIINEVLHLLSIPVASSYAMRLRDIVVKFRNLSRGGHKPIIIFDEAENMNDMTMRMIKGLYDGIAGYSSIVLMGTDQLVRKMQANNRKDKEGAPQFYRRFKAGLRLIQCPEVRQAFLPFFEKFGVEDKGLRKLLCELCENYGELHDYLEPAIRKADELGTPLTEDFFRLQYNMPK